MKSLLVELLLHHRCISFVGAGGKTTLMDHMALEAVARGQQVIMTTTTKIYPFSGLLHIYEHKTNTLLQKIKAAQSQEGLLVVAHSYDADSGKAIGLTVKSLALIQEAFPEHIILVEADGAARKPLKAPQSTEPVLPLGATCCIGLMGLDAVGQCLDENVVHRSSLFTQRTGRVKGETIRADDLFLLAQHPQGLFQHVPDYAQRIVILNKLDIADNTIVQRFSDLVHEHKSTATWFAGSARLERFNQFYPHDAT